MTVRHVPPTITRPQQCLLVLWLIALLLLLHPVTASQPYLSRASGGPTAASGYGAATGEDAMAVMSAASHSPATSPHSSAQDAKAIETLSKMSIRHLKQFLAERRAVCHGCVDRHHLLERALEVRRAPSLDDLVAGQLALAQQSAVTHPQPHHVRTQSPAETAQLLLLQATLAHVRCDVPLPNGTAYCIQHSK